MVIKVDNVNTGRF